MCQQPSLNFHQDVMPDVFHHSSQQQVSEGQTGYSRVSLPPARACMRFSLAFPFLCLYLDAQGIAATASCK